MNKILMGTLIGVGGFSLGFVSCKKLTEALMDQFAKERILGKDIIFGTKKDAHEVLTQLHDKLTKYGVVSVADFKDFAGVTSSFVNNKYGWKDLKRACVIRHKIGYVIDLPKPMLLD